MAHKWRLNRVFAAFEPFALLYASGLQAKAAASTAAATTAKAASAAAPPVARTHAAPCSVPVTQFIISAFNA